ncbi:MAG: ABC transporter permease subunit [Candidatus Zixiibacteriota bacterium]|nr:MAG: ABC transporter permease subunit [candidate division Zixibacteria bacterium]
MFRALVEKEIRDLLGSTKFLLTFVVSAVLIIGAFLVGATRHNLNQRQYEASAAENLRQLDGLTDWNQMEQHRVFLPPQPLAALVSGVSNDIGRTITVTGRGELTATDSRYSEDPIYAVFRFLDLEFIFQIVFSLFAILLGFDAVCGEKERGTLRLALANAVPRHIFIAGKLVGSGAALTVSLLIAVGAGCLLLPIMGISLSAGEWLRLLLIVLTGLLYFGVFLTMSVFVSAITHRSSSSFLAMLVIWIVGVLVVPRVSVLLAGRAVEVPSVDYLSTQKASYREQLWKESRDLMADFQPKANTACAATDFARFMDSLMDVREAKMQIYRGRLDEERHNREQQQQRLAFNIARVSPSTSLTLATSALAGTFLTLKEHFVDEASNYQDSYGQFIKEKTGLNPAAGMKVIKIGESNQEPIDPNELPRFGYQPVPLQQSVAVAAVDMGILTIFNLLFFAGGFLAFGRYDVR